MNKLERVLRVDKYIRKYGKDKYIEKYIEFNKLKKDLELYQKYGEYYKQMFIGGRN